MAHDERYERERGRRPEWRGDDSFGSGWGNQTPRPHRLGDRNWRGESDDPDYGQERYGAGPAGDMGEYGPTRDAGSFFSAPGYDAGFGGPRFDRADVGAVGSHGVHPVSSAVGGDYRGAMGGPPGGFGSSAREFALEQGRRREEDPHYAQWRRRELDRLDRDYDEYRRERQTRFDREFGAWRERRGEQRRAVGRVTEHMEVVGKDSGHVGTVDCTRGEDIILTKSDPEAGGHHHAIPCGWVDSVDDKVHLNLSADEAMERWRDEERSRALFERPGQGQGGPHMLNRSFSGTYDRDRD